MNNRKHMILLTVLCIILGLAAHAFAAGYLANTKSGKYHISTCRTIKHPNAPHFVPYNTEKECVDAGYKPCGVCLK